MTEVIKKNITDSKKGTKKATKAKAPKKEKKVKLNNVSQSSTDDTVVIPDQCAALVLSPEGKVHVYVSNNGDNGYKQHEEIAIAFGALLQNQQFVEGSLKMFRDIFEIANQANNDID